MIERVSYPQRTVVVHRSGSDFAPVLAGLIGGFVLGATVTHAAPPVEVGYAYWDPYCEDRYASLDRYEWHLRHCNHPRMVRVLDARSGECVGSEVWRDGRWCPQDGYRGGDRDRYGYDRDGYGRDRYGRDDD